MNRARKRYIEQGVGRGLELLCPLLARCPLSTCVFQPRNSLNPSFRSFVNYPLCLYDWLNHQPLGLELCLPPWRSRYEVESSRLQITSLVPLATAPTLKLSKGIQLRVISLAYKKTLSLMSKISRGLEIFVPGTWEYDQILWQRTF